MRAAKFPLREKFFCRVANNCSKLPQDLVDNLGFIIRVKKFHNQNVYPLSHISNKNEIAVWLDMPGETAVAQTNERIVLMCNTGHDKGCFTIVLMALGDGRKLKPFVIFK